MRPAPNSRRRIFNSHSRFITLAMVASLLVVAAGRLAAQDTAAGKVQPAATPSVPDAAKHPLAPTLRYASDRYDFIRQHVRDYRCLVVKRERIDGRLQDLQYLRASVRQAQLRDGRVVAPLSVYMEFLAPRKMAGRRLLFVEGRHEGKMLVRKGGQGLEYVKLKIDPHGPTARRESRYPVTDLGFEKIIERLLEQMRDDIEHDPDGSNTQVSYFQNAKINERPCTHVRVVHPVRRPGLDFHVASIYVDHQLKVPVRMAAYDWPAKEGGESPLIEEYTYVDLMLNVGLTDDDFSEAKLD